MCSLNVIVMYTMLGGVFGIRYIYYLLMIDLTLPTIPLNTIYYENKISVLDSF